MQSWFPGKGKANNASSRGTVSNSGNSTVGNSYARMMANQSKIPYINEQARSAGVNLNSTLVGGNTTYNRTVTNQTVEVPPNSAGVTLRVQKPPAQDHPPMSHGVVISYNSVTKNYFSDYKGGPNGAPMAYKYTFIEKKPVYSV